MIVTLDFETASFCNLKKAGAFRYAQDPNTEVLSLVFHSDDDNQYRLWTPDNLNGLLERFAADPNVLFRSHASFEQAIWQWIMVPVFGFASIPIARWVDTQAACALHAIPLDLDHALIVMDLPVVKDLAGRTVTLAMSRFDRKGMLPVRTPEMMETIYGYNRVDVVGTVFLGNVLGDLPQSERRIWEIDQEINQRGVRIDLPFVRACKRLRDQSTGPLLDEFKTLTGLKPTQGKKFLVWLGEQGVDLPNLKKETVAAILGEDDGDNDTSELLEVSGDARRALHIRALVNSTSLAKLESMEACIGVDGRARGLVQYHAASTGRWGGRILQPQNFPRGDITGGTVDEKIAAVYAADRPGIMARFKKAGHPCDPLELIVGSLRHCLIADSGRVFVSGDFASIEARIVLALAGQHDKCGMMAAGQDVYCDVASLIYGRKVTKADVELRQTGKNTVLGCGFGMGKKTFHNRYCPLETEEFAKGVISTYRKEWAPLVPRLWKGQEAAALSAATNPGQAYWSHGIGWNVKVIGGKNFMVCRLLDGKYLYYFDPRCCLKEMPWSTEEKPDIRPAWKYRAKKGISGAWKWIDAYGGIETENVVQALARQLLCRAMERLTTAGWPIVLTVHDEIVCEMPDDGTDWRQEFERILCEPVEWATEIKVPVQVECWQGHEYRK